MAGYHPVRVQKAKSSSVTQHGTIVRSNFDTSTFVTIRGLRLPERMSFDKWIGIGSYLSKVFTSSAWCLGDWLVYGEAAFNGRYRDAIELTSLDYQTLRNHAWVARRFPMSRRRDTLSFTHHAEVAALTEPEQDFWLRKAEEHGWSVKRLRREVKGSLLERATDRDLEPGDGQPAEDAVAPPRGDTVLLRVPISADRLDSCHAAASKLGLNVEAWAVQILLKAAAQVFDEHLQQDLLPGGLGAQSYEARSSQTPLENPLTRVWSWLCSAIAAGREPSEGGHDQAECPGPMGFPAFAPSGPHGRLCAPGTAHGWSGGNRGRAARGG